MVRRYLKLLLPCLVIAVVVGSGFVTTVLDLTTSTTAVAASGTFMLDAEMRFAVYNGYSCAPEYTTGRATMTQGDFNNISRVVAQLNARNIQSTIESLTEACTEAVIACTNLAQLGGVCDPADIYSNLPSQPIPVDIHIVGYVANVSVVLNNRLPLQMSVTGAGKGLTIDASFPQVSCDARCSFTGRITLPAFDTSGKSIIVTLVIDAHMPVTWGLASLWFRIGTMQRTIDVSLELIPSSGIVRLTIQS